MFGLDKVLKVISPVLNQVKMYSYVTCILFLLDSTTLEKQTKGLEHKIPSKYLFAACDQ